MHIYITLSLGDYNPIQRLCQNILHIIGDKNRSNGFWSRGRTIESQHTASIANVKNYKPSQKTRCSYEFGPQSEQPFKDSYKITILSPEEYIKDSRLIS